ncbi:MAG: DUF169 domain-containing protein [Eubacteriales bacterium]
MEDRIARELQMKFEPVAVIFTNELPPDALQFKEGKWGCVIAMLTASAKGRITAFSRETCGCGGGRVGLGFGGFLEGMRGGIEYFLSSGREGHSEGEGYKKTPGIAKSFVDQLPVTDIPYTYVVFKPLSLADPEKETLQLIIFYGSFTSQKKTKRTSLHLKKNVPSFDFVHLTFVCFVWYARQAG